MSRDISVSDLKTLNTVYFTAHCTQTAHRTESDPAVRAARPVASSPPAMRAFDDDVRVRRVVVYGSSGAGKSTLAADLVALGVGPHVEIDALAYDDGVHVEQAVLRERFATAVAGDRWVVEGMHRDQLEVAIARADVFVWIDLPRRVIARRLTARTIGHAIRRRPRHGRRVTLSSLLRSEAPFIVKTVRSVPRRRAHASRLVELARRSDAAVVHLTSSAGVRTWVSQRQPS